MGRIQDHACEGRLTCPLRFQPCPPVTVIPRSMKPHPTYQGREAIKCAEQFAKAQAFLRFQRCVSKAVRAVRSANIAKLHSQQVCCRNAFHHWYGCEEYN